MGDRETGGGMGFFECKCTFSSNSEVDTMHGATNQNRNGEEKLVQYTYVRACNLRTYMYGVHTSRTRAAKEHKLSGTLSPSLGQTQKIIAHNPTSPPPHTHTRLPHGTALGVHGSNPGGMLLVIVARKHESVLP